MSFRDFFRGRRVLVTGDTGFKGAWLALWLRELGAEVHGLALDPRTDPSLFRLLDLEGKIEHHDVDLRRLDDVRDLVRVIHPDAVFHLAAQAIVRVSYEEPIETLQTNFMGTAHLLQGVREAGYTADRPCVVVCVTSDKCYENVESYHAYRETDPVGGHDIYSMSKGSTELLISSWRRSFFHPSRWREHGVSVASARAGNVIGGGDWAEDRILVDAVRALTGDQPIGVRNPGSIRPWQHVLEPLSGYLQLGAEMGGEPGKRPEILSAFNFGPGPDSERTVRELVEAVLREWGAGSWSSTRKETFAGLHEATYLKLSTDKARHLLGWEPVWDFATTVRETVGWYRRAHDGHRDGGEMVEATLAQIRDFGAAAAGRGIRWAG